MRIVVQRVSGAAVEIENGPTRSIGEGLLLLVGFSALDSEDTCVFMAKKCAELRIFSDDAGAMNRSLLDVGGGALIVSNFTLYANCKKGRRPSFIEAAPPEQAIPLYDCFVDHMRALGIAVQTGEFGAHMQVQLTNDGPVTILLDSEQVMPKK